MDLRITTDPQQGATYGQLLGMAQAVEQSGLDAMFFSDHLLHQSFDEAGSGSPAYGGSATVGLPGPTDCWLTIAALARETSRIRLGTLMSAASFRLPGPLAVAVAQIDAMSGGRVELGLGAGWAEEEHAAYGIPYRPLPERMARLEEQLAIVTGLWTTPVGELFSFAGRYHQAVDSPGLPKPLQKPHPPILVGGRGKRVTPRLAARFAAEYNYSFDTPETTAEYIELVRRACEAVDRDPDSLIYSAAMTVCCGENEASAARRAERVGLKLDALRQANAAVGTPAEVVERLHVYGKLGIHRVYLRLFDFDDLEQIALIGDAILPHVS